MPAIVQPNIVGTKQDISDEVFFAKPEETPFISLVEKQGPPKQEIHQYQAGIRKGINKRGVRDATDVTTQRNHEDRKLIEINFHLVQEGFGIGKKAQSFTDVAGRADLLRNEIAQTSLLVKRAMDEICCDDSDQRDEGANGLGSETRGLGSWLSASAQTCRPVPEEHRTPSASIYTGTGAAFTESQFKSLMSSLWDVSRGRKNYTLFCGYALKQGLADFQTYTANKEGYTVARGFRGDLEKKKMSSMIDILEVDAGTVTAMASANLGKSRDSTDDAATVASNWRGYILDMDGVALKMGLEPQHHPLPDQGGGPRGYVDAFFGLKCFPRVHAKIAPSAAS